MIGFVGLMGVLFILIRSDYLLDYRHFSETTATKVVESNSELLTNSYPQPTFLVLTSSDQTKISDSVTETVEQLGKKVDLVDIGDELDLSNADYDGILIATENLDSLTNLEELITYVEQGGSVFFTVRPSPGTALSSLYQRLGMIEVGSFIETYGIELSEPYFKDSFSQSFHSEKIINSSLSVRLENKATVYAASSDGLPLFWSTRYGQGRFIMFNGTILSDSSQNALLIQGIQKMVPNLIYPVINAKVTALKGFPFPISGGKHKSGGNTNEEYFQQVIWAEMQRLEAKYDLNYTASFVSSFDTDPNSSNANDLSSTQENLVTIGRELLRMGGEMGVQGFNHLPLSKKSTLDVKAEMNKVSTVMQEAIPGYQVKSYIPVNQVDPFAHLQQVQDGFPELSVILADVNKPVVKNRFSILPTTMNGYETNEYSNWLIVNEVAKSGYFSQSLSLEPFVYSDSFEQMKTEFSLFQSNIRTEVPWLRSLTLSQTAQALPQYTQTKIYEENKDNEVTYHLTRFSSPAFFYFYTEAGIRDTENCKMTKIGSNLYLIKAEKPTFTIRLDG